MRPRSCPNTDSPEVRRHARDRHPASFLFRGRLDQIKGEFRDPAAEEAEIDRCFSDDLVCRIAQGQAECVMEDIDVGIFRVGVPPTRGSEDG
jgi:hypothetical protein